MLVQKKSIHKKSHVLCLSSWSYNKVMCEVGDLGFKSYEQQSWCYFARLRIYFTPFTFLISDFQLRMRILSSEFRTLIYEYSTCTSHQCIVQLINFLIFSAGTKTKKISMYFLLHWPTTIDLFTKPAPKQRRLACFYFCTKDSRTSYIQVQILDPSMPYISGQKEQANPVLETMHHSIAIT